MDTAKLTAAELASLREYSAAATRGVYAVERLPHAVDLEKRGLLEWMGRYMGTEMYRITDAGRAAIASATGEG